MKKYIFYFLGIIIMAFSVSLCFQCGFGAASIDALNKNIADAFNCEFITVGRVVIVENLLFVLCYFLVFKPKDILLPIIVTFTLGSLIDLFDLIPIVSSTDHIAVRIIFFIIAINLMCLGIALQVFDNLSPSAFECVTLIVNKYLHKLSYGTCKFIIEIVVIILASLIALIFIGNFGEISLATFIILLLQGKLIDVYLSLIKKVKFLH